MSSFFSSFPYIQFCFSFTFGYITLSLCLSPPISNPLHSPPLSSPSSSPTLHYSPLPVSSFRFFQSSLLKWDLSLCLWRQIQCGCQGFSSAEKQNFSCMGVHLGQRPSLFSTSSWEYYGIVEIYCGVFLLIV